MSERPTRKPRMRADELRQNLAKAVAAIERTRDESYAKSAKDDSDDYHYGQWSGAALALAYLHNWTEGEYGTPLHRGQHPHSREQKRGPHRG